MGDILIGLLRLRKCSDDTFRPELKDGVSVVRELHAYGSVVPVAAKDPKKFQHQGFGMLLMEEAEKSPATNTGPGSWPSSAASEPEIITGNWVTNSTVLTCQR